MVNEKDEIIEGMCMNGKGEKDLDVIGKNNL